MKKATDTTVTTAVETASETVLETVATTGEETALIETTAPAKEPGFEAFTDTLPIMGKGMLGIFAVTLIIIGVIYILGMGKKGKK